MRCKCVLSIAVASSVSLLSQAEIIWLCSSTVYSSADTSSFPKNGVIYLSTLACIWSIRESRVWLSQGSYSEKCSFRFSSAPFMGSFSLEKSSNSSLALAKSSSVIWGRAERSAPTSSSMRVSMTSLSSLQDSLVTTAPLLGYILTRPCASSWRKASRTGIWLTLNAADISSCLRGISPGSSPRTMAVRIT